VSSEQDRTRRKVGLALSGGAARGFAHLGVLQVLEREGVPIDCIAGTSAGSVVGVAYAAGVRGERLMELARQVRWRRVARPVWPRYGLVSFAGLEALLIQSIGDRTFADLELPYACVAADLATGDPVVLREGRVAPAVRASCSVAGFVSPVEVGGRWLTDGGAINNLPISVVRSLGAEVVIAVDLVVPLGRRPRDLLEITSVAIEMLIAHASDRPETADVYVPVPLASLGSLVRLSTADKTMAAGRRAAERALPAIRAAVFSPTARG